MGALSIVACGRAGTLVLDAPEPEVPDPTTQPPAQEPSATCGAVTARVESQWQTPMNAYGVWRGVFGVSPDGQRGIAVGGQYDAGTAIYQLADGTVTADDNHNVYVFAQDAAWQRRVQIDQERLEVVDVRTGAALLSMPLDECCRRWHPSGLSLNAEGTSLFGVRCVEDRWVPTQWPIDGVGEVRSIQTDERCGAGIDGQHVALVGDVMFFVIPTGTTLYRVDFELGTLSATRVADEATLQHEIGHYLLEVAADRAGDEVAVTSTDGRLQFLNPSTLEVVRTLDAGFTPASRDIYAAPQSFGPVAWSSDGELFAHVDANGSTVVRASCDAHVLATLEAPILQRPGARTWGAIDLAFGPDSRTLFVRYEAGTELFSITLDPPN